MADDQFFSSAELPVDWVRRCARFTLEQVKEGRARHGRNLQRKIEERARKRAALPWFLRWLYGGDGIDMWDDDKLEQRTYRHRSEDAARKLLRLCRTVERVGQRNIRVGIDDWKYIDEPTPEDLAGLPEVALPETQRQEATGQRRLELE